ncbi:hypothetical protein IM793_01085 [Pedobacter sp. MR2016-19]|uniref:hypothetical protein n=1 Tax=Pedobacter sp. MR2016-19 TaxID=2780089 RepID=UPI0018754D8E|nr:hypothetical protein [Pedobacter sp. MR2016-19]MBE5317738.1 hypothetical protein [Pedobacter sp. MR2016-19]
MKKTLLIKHKAYSNRQDIHYPLFYYIILNRDLSFEEVDHVKEQFSGRKEYRRIGQANIKDKNTKSHTILAVIEEAEAKEYDFIILCKNYHDFPPSYNSKFFENCLLQANSIGANVLLGGATGFVDSVKIIDNLFWIDFFADSTFIIIYKRFYKNLASLVRNNSLQSIERIISDNANNIMLTYPFISFPREFQNSKSNTFKEYYLSERALTIIGNAYNYLKIRRY